MVLPLQILYEAIARQALTLDTVSEGDIKHFAGYIDKLPSEEKFTPEEIAAAKRINKAIENCPRTNLAITRVRRDLVKIMVEEPESNAEICGMPRNFLEIYKKTPAEFDPKKYTNDLYAIIEMDTEEPPLLIETSSSIGKIISGDEIFTLYGKFRDYDNPQKVSNNLHRGRSLYPIDRIEAPDTKKEIILPLYETWVSAFLFVGNRKEQCKEALVYIGQKYLDPPKGFHMLVETRAVGFAFNYIENRGHIKDKKTIQELDLKVAELEKIVAEQN